MGRLKVIKMGVVKGVVIYSPPHPKKVVYTLASSNSPTLIPSLPLLLHILTKQ